MPQPLSRIAPSPQLRVSPLIAKEAGLINGFINLTTTTDPAERDEQY
jgi:hypothetical protein